MATTNEEFATGLGMIAAGATEADQPDVATTYANLAADRAAQLEKPAERIKFATDYLNGLARGPGALVDRHAYPLHYPN